MSDVQSAVAWDRVIGVEWVEASADRVVARWTIRPDHHQPFGIVHGGVYCAVVESAASYGGQKWLEADGRQGRVVGMSNSTDFLRSISEGELTAVALPVLRPGPVAEPDRLGSDQAIRRGDPMAAGSDAPDGSARFTSPDGTELDLPVASATEGSAGADISKLLAKTGLVTFDPGFANTASCASAITYIDGDAGILRYRGYPIDELAEHSTFLETTYLLIYGELPTADQLAEFGEKISRHTLLHEDLKRFFDGFPRDAHPMPVLSSAVSALSTFYQDSHNPFDDEQVELSTVRLLAKVPTIAAYAYKKSIGQPFLYPDNSLGLVENFLRMTFGLPAEPYEADPAIVRALDMLFVLHADHEQNCSTSTVRLVGSSQANLFASVSAGISALFGPLHGGANQAVLEMLENIRASGGDVGSFVRKVKNKEDGVKLMGFGHRVYKNYDPRATVIKKMADEILSALGKRDDLLDIAMELEGVALSDDYFIERKLYPNVDFYTGLLYRAMGFPTRMFTVLFAIGRLPGWIAQWHEMINDPQTKIGRPRQLYTGPAEREFVAMEKR